jgi:hypothetical protein
MRRLVVVGAMLAIGVLSCSHKEERFDSVVQVLRKEVLEKDEKGNPTEIDFEFEWDPCPGDQFQVIRGGKEFAECSKDFEPGDYLPVVVKRFWDPRGYYRWDIEKVGSCSRDIEPASYGSYEKSAECKDVKNNGRVIGFECSRKPFRNLVQRCPWMARD